MLLLILKTFLAKIIRDIIIFLHDDYVRYIYKDKHFIYKWGLPFNLTLGIHRFLKKEDYDVIENEYYWLNKVKD